MIFLKSGFYVKFQYDKWPPYPFSIPKMYAFLFLNLSCYSLICDTPAMKGHTWAQFNYKLECFIEANVIWQLLKLMDHWLKFDLLSLILMNLSFRSCEIKGNRAIAEFWTRLLIFTVINRIESTKDHRYDVISLRYY